MLRGYGDALEGTEGAMDDSRDFERALMANGQRPGIRLVSHEVEKQLRMVPGTLFGLTADVKNWKDDAQGKSGKTNATVSTGKVPTDLRGRTMFLGEAKEILKAFREALLSPAVMRTMQNIEQKGGVHMDQHRRVLITQDWNPILKRFDFPPTEAGYEAMKTGIRQFAENEYVRSCCHEVEGLCGAPPGSYFGVPTVEEMAARAEEKRKAEEEAAKIEAEKRQAEEARKRKEEEETRRKQEEARQKEEEEEAKRREEEAREKKRKEEEEAKRREDEEVPRRKQEEETKRKEEEETKMNEEKAREMKQEQVTAEEAEAQSSVEGPIANEVVDKEDREEPASQVSRDQEKEEEKCRQQPDQDQEAIQRQEEQGDVNKNSEELNDSSSRSEVGANLCNSHEDPERRRQIEEEKRIVNGDAKLEADREAAAKRSSEGATGGPSPQAASPGINDTENGTLNGHLAAAKNQVEEEPRENVSTHQALRPLPVLRAKDPASDALGVVQREAVVQGVCEGPWLRLLPSSCRALGVLGERGYLPLEDLQPTSPCQALPMGAAGRFKVRAAHVAVRAHPELRGKVVGVVVAGRMLMGTPHKVAGYLWLRFEESSRKKVGDEEAWALVQDLGGDVLLEPLDADGRRALSNFRGSQVQAIDPHTADSGKVGATAVPVPPTAWPAEKLPTPVTDPVKVSQRVEAAALARKQLRGPLEFRVLAEDHSAPVRKEPLVQSPQLGKLERGELVYGYPGGGWLQLMHSELENSWVFIGTRLSAVWAELRVTARSWNALEVTWPGLH
eukprot:s861_g40.t1